MKQGFSILSAVVLVTQSLTSSVVAQIPDSFGAIAITPDASVWGYAYNHPTRAEAERQALEECGQADCQVKLWFKNACGAIAKDDQGNLGWAWAETRTQAEAEAISSCGTGTCQIETWVCTTRYDSAN
jgi:serine/threonine-protein kinase